MHLVICNFWVMQLLVIELFVYFRFLHLITCTCPTDRACSTSVCMDLHRSEYILTIVWLCMYSAVANAFRHENYQLSCSNFLFKLKAFDHCTCWSEQEHAKNLHDSSCCCTAPAVCVTPSHSWNEWIRKYMSLVVFASHTTRVRNMLHKYLPITMKLQTTNPASKLYMKQMEKGCHF